MILNVRQALPVLFILVALTLSGCESSEERAERHYQSALELLESGDVARAIVEFRNVFKYDEQHREARETYAGLMIDRGQINEGYGQYLRLIEQYPDTVVARLTLAEIAVARGDWEEVRRHGNAATELAPDLPRSRALAAALAYRAAVEADDAAALDAAVADAQSVLAATPEMIIARRVLIDALINGRTPQLALAEVEAALEQEPESLEFHSMKLGLLASMSDDEQVREQLLLMSELFPQNEDIQRTLISWYMQQDDLPAVEAYLRKLADAAPEEAAPRLVLVQFLRVTQGAEAAQAELDALIAAATKASSNEASEAPVRQNADLYRALKASIDFDQGKRSEAIAALEGLLKEAIPSDQTRGIKVSLAQMLQRTGNIIGSRSLLEEVLAEDPAQVDALKMQAAGLIEADKPGEAIIALRSALDQNPRDPETLTLMAAAHERDGSRELAGERLALAVEVSGSGARESLRYAQFVLRDGRTEIADSVLTEALRVAPGDMRLLEALAGVRIAAQDWSRAQETIAQLRQLGTDEARRLADEAQAKLMLRQDRADDTVAFLQDLIDQGDADISAIAVVLQTLVRQEKMAEARSYIDERLKLNPEDVSLRLLNANLHASEGNLAEAEAIFRSIVDELPGAEMPVSALYQLLRRNDRPGEATALLDQALATENPALGLRWLKAGELEAAGDIEGAIAIYEAAYEANSGNPVIANNLASLITTYRDDAESLERAFAISRRLRGIEVPAFQDTYGWIEARRGNHEEALRHLEPAAAGLPQDPLVQYHLGMTYAALNRVEEARETLTRALELAGDSPLAQFTTARDTLEGLPVGQ